MNDWERAELAERRAEIPRYKNNSQKEKIKLAQVSQSANIATSKHGDQGKRK